MDDEDSQDELINRNMSRSKGKRSALWAISDDSDDVEEESEEGESISGEEDEEGNQDGEEDDDEEDDDEDEDEEEEKAEDGARREASADLVALSSDEDSDKCPICLNSFSNQPVATPENCEHYFCLDCILEWAKNANSCPVDRMAFNGIYLRKCYGGKVKKMITIKKPVKEGQEERVDLDLEQTSCEVCGGSDREDRLLLCDGCDAGYHMECLTPPLDSVPVEEWFCPECEANNRPSRGSAEELSDAESLPSNAISRPQAQGPTRAIARTQQSERVRANVNRHRITQARTSQLAPTYLIESTWLDDTINAVVAGLNTSVYVRDLTPRVSTSHRRKSRKRRKVKRKTSSAVGKVTGVKRKKRKVRRTKSRKKLVLKKTTTRSRIANSLGIVKDKKSSSLPTVYRPTEHTLSGMRADIGAASLSVYGDPFDLDPFVDHEEEEQQAHVTSLLEAKRRGISRSALRSHQPVARPVTSSLSRRVMDVPQRGGVVEAAPMPDLLGSILSGQSILLMDSSDVVINRDGSLKATKPIMPSALKPDCSKSCSSGDASTQINPIISPNQGDRFPSPHYSEGFSHSSTNIHFSHSTSHLPPHIPSSASPIQPSPQGHPKLQPPCHIRPTHLPGQRGTNGLRAPCPASSIHLTLDSNSKSNGKASSQSQSKKAPTKPMWVDVSVLPRIPKIKRESSITNDGSNSSSSNSANSSNSTSHGNGYGMQEMGINSFTGDKGRQQSVDRQKGRADGQRPRPDTAGSSSNFSNSFCSSSAGSHASQPCYSSSSSSSSAVSFRINSSGNSWHSRRLNTGLSSASGNSMQEPWREKEDEARKRQLHRDKQMLLASRALANKEQDINNIYDPFNPTLSDSSSSDDEAESTSLDGSCRHATHDGKAHSLGNEECLAQSKPDLVHVKAETQEIKISEEEPRIPIAQETISQVRCPEEHVMVEQEFRLVDNEMQTRISSFDIKIKEEPGLQNVEEAERFGDDIKSLNSETETTPPVHHSLELIKTERETPEKESASAGTSNTSPPNNSSAPNSDSIKTKQKAETKLEPKSCSKSPSRDLGPKKNAFQAAKEQRSSNPKTDRCRRGDHRISGEKGQQKEMKNDRKRSSRRSWSRERRRARSSSESSQSSSPDRSRRRRRRSRSQSRDNRCSRSGSSSSSREHSQRKKHKRKSKERADGREGNSERRRVPKDKIRDRSHSKSRSKSRSRSSSRSRSRLKDHKRGRPFKKSRSKSRSRSRERWKDHAKQQQSYVSSRHKGESKSKDKRKRRSRSSSRERKKEEGLSSKSSQRISGPCVSSSKNTKQSQAKKKEKDIAQSSLKEEKVASVRKQVTPFHLKESKDVRTESQATAAEMAKEMKVEKEIKKEKQPSLDIFGDSPITKPIKKEEIDTYALMEVKDEEENKDIPIKAGTCDFSIIKSEPSSPEFSHVPSLSTLSTPERVDSLQDTVPQSQPVSLVVAVEPIADGLTVPENQDVQQHSDSDDDFSVDVMLDNLVYEKSVRTEGNAASVKQEKEVKEGMTEGGQVSTVLGTKSKNQVKRVTWNIQEPEGPQPEKSASKLALYKLKLKQEGARRPSSVGQTSSQDVTGAVSDPSKKGTVVPLSSSSRSDGAHPEGASTTEQEETKEGDLSRKDKYLKKLHMQERAIEEVKLAIKPYYQRRDINKDEYKEILRKAVQKVCHSKSGEINPVKVGNLVKAYVDKYKHARKHKKGEDSGKTQDENL